MINIEGLPAPGLKGIDWADLNDEMLETEQQTPEQWAVVDALAEREKARAVPVTPAKVLAWRARHLVVPTYNDGLPDNYVMWYDTGWITAHRS